MLRFYWRIVRRTPRLLLRALRDLDTGIGILALIFAAVGLSTWQDLLPWWAPYGAFGVILLYGFLRENYEEFSAVEDERGKLQRQLTTSRKRRATLDLLGRYHAKGRKLVRSHPRVEEIPQVAAGEVSGWSEGVYRLIRAAYGFGQAEVFLSGKDPDDAEVWLRECLAQLVRLMEQTSELELRPDFDPEDFALQDEERGSGS